MSEYFGFCKKETSEDIDVHRCSLMLIFNVDIKCTKCRLQKIRSIIIWNKCFNMLWHLFVMLFCIYHALLLLTLLEWSVEHQVAREYQSPSVLAWIQEQPINPKSKSDLFRLKCNSKTTFPNLISNHTFQLDSVGFKKNPDHLQKCSRCLPDLIHSLFSKPIWVGKKYACVNKA